MMKEIDDPALDGDIQDRLIRVENSLYFRMAKSRYLPDYDSDEIERLERLRQELRSRYERARQSHSGRRRSDTLPRISLYPSGEF
jgi:hypothetical protein